MLVLVGPGLGDLGAHLVDGGKGVVEAGTGRGELVAAAEAGREELGRPQTVGVGLPEIVAAISLEPFDTRLAAFAPFDHGLDGLQRVDIAAVVPAAGHAHRLRDLSAQRHVDRGHAPGDRQRRAGHKGKAQFHGSIVHLARPIPVPRQVLVVEYRGRFAGGAEDCGHLLEEFVARVELLPFGIVGIVAVLGDEQHAVDGEVVAAQGQRVGDGGVDVELGEARGALAAQISLVHLIDVERDQIHLGAVVAAVPAIAL